MTNKLEKKELEEPDKLTILFTKIRSFVETHRSKIYLGAGIAVVIFLIAGGFYLYQANYENRAAGFYNGILTAQMKAGSPAGDEALTKGLKELLSKYPRSNAASLGHYRLGNLYYNRRAYDEAEASYHAFIKSASSDNDLIALAYNGLGACAEQKKDLKKALEFYDLAMKTKAGSSFESINYSNIARIYEELKDNKKAVEFYQKALLKTTDPARSILIKRKLSLLS
ncbi:MAG: tetratricopeptide repeat protein [Syntrophales bacterium]|jgi:predicted negative regulator of RcsB-dependent stress response|nr:tetratricopeptide repeat protein [Syntrophales bacterium]